MGQGISVTPFGNLEAGDLIASVPTDFPELITSVRNDPADGYYYMSNIFGGNPYLLIFDNTGRPVFYSKLPGNVYDFNRHANGMMSYYLRGEQEQFYILDFNFNLLDSLKFVGGKKTNNHELRILEDGGMLVIVDSPDTVDMSKIVPGGKRDAVAIGNNVVEIDADGNVIRQWEWQNYFKPTDALNINLLSARIDFMHMNSIEVDIDGNLLVSNRNLCEITKLNRKTGELIWRFGGKNNQFTILNDSSQFQFEEITLPFSYQHHIRVLPNGNYLFYDNGNLRPTHYSRAVEYKIDTAAMTAELIWKYDEGTENASRWWGSVQRLENGNTLIGWGGQGNKAVTEVSAGGNVEFEATFKNDDGCYRVNKSKQAVVSELPYLTVEPFQNRVDLYFNHFGQRPSQFIIYSGLDVSSLSPIDTVELKSAHVSGMTSPKTYYFAVRSIDSSGAISELSNIQKVFVNFYNAGKNFLLNGDFNSSVDYWEVSLSNGAAATIEQNNGELVLKIDSAGTSPEDVQIQQKNINLRQGRRYRVSFDARAAGAGRIITPKLRKPVYPFYDYSASQSVYIEKSSKTFRFEFEMLRSSDPHAILSFECGGNTASVFLDNISIVDLTTVEVHSTDIPNEFTLAQNYPNPFNISTNIEFSIPQRGRVKISIYNILGEHLLDLTDKIFPSGQNFVNFDAADIASGIYIYRVMFWGGRNQEYIKSKKMILIK